MRCGVSIWLALFLSFCSYPSRAANNGLGMTPPMGWNSWLVYGCNVNCTSSPLYCLSEKNLRAIADSMVSGGFRDAGYEYLVIDDCWLAPKRASDGRQIPDPNRFPSGIKSLADYVHARGLKFGIYTDIGTRTCAGYPGSESFLQLDAQTYAEWGVDYLKVDGCASDNINLAQGFQALGLFLNRTGRPIFYSCEWPAYDLIQLRLPNFTAIQATCNAWRTFLDMKNYWQRVVEVITFWALNPLDFGNFSGPSSFSNPDILIIGNGGLSEDQEVLMMSMWAMFSAPLLIAADLRSISSTSRAILTNRHVLAINQDPLGKMASLIKARGMLQLWRKPLYPKPPAFALAILNLDSKRSTSGSLCLTDFGLSAETVNIINVVVNSVVCNGCNCFNFYLRPSSSLLLRTGKAL